MKDIFVHEDISRRRFLRAAGLGAAGALIGPAIAWADGRSVEIGNHSVDLALEWFRARGNDVIDLRGPGWNDVGTDVLVARGPDRGPAEIKGTAGASGPIRYRPGYRGWFDAARSFDQRDPAYALDRLYKIASDHPNPLARREARRLLADGALGRLHANRVELHGVGGPSPRIQLAGREAVQLDHYTRAFGSPRPLFDPALRGAQAIGRGLFYIGIVADVAASVERFVEVEEAYDSGQIGPLEREQLHAASAFGRLGTWAGALGGAQVGGLLAAALMTNPGGWALLGTLGIVGLGTAAGVLVGRWAFETLGMQVVRLVHEMGGSLGGLIDRAAPAIEVLHTAIGRCVREASSVLVTARAIARALWDAVSDLLTMPPQPAGPRPVLTA